jgi:fructose-bisphosphate aldolase class II
VPLTPLPTLLDAARSGGYAVGYFEAWDAYSLEAVLAAAEAERSPVILGFGCLLLDQAWLDAGGIEFHGALGRRVAERSRVPVSLLLNEAHTLEQALRGAAAGFNAVMLHTEDADAVAGLVSAVHRSGVAVEGELGELPDAAPDGRVDASRASVTDPDEAAAFVAATGVDCLAVSFGNVHTLEGSPAEVDLDRLAAINARVDVPLVVHGGTGFPPDAVPGAIARGVAKFNVGTVLKRAALRGIVDAATSVPDAASPHDLLGSHGSLDLLGAGTLPLVETVRELIRRYGGSGRA